MILSYDKKDVLPYMPGMWQDALQQICGLKSTVFNKKHQPCPNCGGKDRFRWTDNLDKVGDGGAICNVCGNDSGIGWLMKLSGQPYHECINILGRFLGKIPQEYVVKKNLRASRASGYSFGAQVEHEKCEAVMSRTELVTMTPLSAIEGFSCLDGESFTVGVKTLPDGSVEEIHAIPCLMVHDDGLDDEMCNILFIDNENTRSFYAKTFTRGSVAATGKTDKTIYLCKDWIDAQHIHMATGQEVWACFTSSNLEIVAYRYKGDRRLRVVCDPDDFDTLCAAEERELEVMIPINGNLKMGIEKKIYKASDLLQS